MSTYFSTEGNLVQCSAGVVVDADARDAVLDGDDDVDVDDVDVDNDDDDNVGFAKGVVH